VQCFSQLFSLIEDKEEININSNNYSIFQYWSNVLENRYLESFCQSSLVSQSQHFFLSSKRFYDISSSSMNSIDNFTILLKNSSIRRNKLFVSLISDRIFNLLKGDLSTIGIDFSDFDENLLILVFNLLKGFSLNLEWFSSELISNLINFLQFNSF
jgi:hypothetical protein